MSILNSYTKEEFERILNESINYTDCLKRLGYNSISGDSIKALKKKIEEYNLSVEHFSNTRTNTVRTEENVFCKDSTASQRVLRNWYSKGQYTEYKCAICGQKPFWNNKPMTLILDHINGNTLDNRKNNLRICTNRENTSNRTKLGTNNTSGILGVRFDNRRNKWYADIQYKGKCIFLGYFNIKEDAIKARIDAEKLYFKEFKSKILNNEVN